METSENQLLIRPLEVGDFTFVRELAAQQQNFTIPPPYVLWMLLKLKPVLSLIATLEKEPLGYLLALPVGDASESVFVWQLATSGNAKGREAGTRLVQEFKAKTSALRFESIVFTSTPGTAHFRAVRQYISNVFGLETLEEAVLPEIVAVSERQYRVSLADDSSDEPASRQLSRSRQT